MKHRSRAARTGTPPGPVPVLVPQRVIRLIAVLLASITSAPGRPCRRGERGDVPGWVLVTVMTAGLVAGLWAIAGPELERMLRQALSSVA